MMRILQRLRKDAAATATESNEAPLQGFRLDCGAALDGRLSYGSVTFLQPMKILEARDLLDRMVDLIARGVRHWEFNMTQLAGCDSTTIGSIIQAHGLLKRESGSMHVRLKKRSPALQAMRQAKVDRYVRIFEA